MSPNTVADVVARMLTIAAEVPAGDGVGVFDRMYLRGTEMVQDRLTTGGVFFIDAFMADLDVRFAQLFFAAYDATGAVPRAWAPLFEARARPGLLPIQSALAGANAHIEHGLPLVMVTPAPRTGARRPAPGCAWTRTRSTNSSPMSKPRSAGPC